MTKELEKEIYNYLKGKDEFFSNLSGPAYKKITIKWEQISSISIIEDYVDFLEVEIKHIKFLGCENYETFTKDVSIYKEKLKKIKEKL